MTTATDGSVGGSASSDSPTARHGAAAAAAAAGSASETDEQMRLRLKRKLQRNRTSFSTQQIDELEKGSFASSTAAVVLSRFDRPPVSCLSAFCTI